MYKDISIIKVISTKPQNFYIWRFYQILPSEDKDKFLDKMFSLPIPQSDIEFTPIHNEGGSAEHMMKSKETGKKVLIHALNADKLKEIKKGQKKVLS